LEVILKILVETTGEFQLVDPYTMELLPSDRPAVVTSTSFVETRCAKGEVTVLSQLKDDATDEEFVEYWKEGSDIAVESFKSKFAPEAVTKKAEEPKGKKAK
jgi:hypothetical protein